MKLNIPEYVKAVIEDLEKRGFEAYVVGGCVRDAILGDTPSDYDITTSATPDVLLQIFSQDGFSAIPTGIPHGTVTVVKGKEAVEVTTFRIDGEYSDFRHPKNVEFTSSLAKDLMRRDFTVNAMAYSHKKGLVDLSCGVSDIENKTIRAVGNPQKRFTEDPLRILRGIRFCSVLDFHMEEETKKAAKSLSYLLEKISKERISAELIKLIMGKASTEVLCEYSDIIFPVTEIKPDSTHTVLEAFSSAVKLQAELFVRLAVLYSADSSENVYKTLCNLRFDSKTAKLTASLIDNLNYEIHDYIAAKHLCRKIGLREAVGVAKLRIARGLGKEDILEYFCKIQKSGECFSLNTLAVNGRDLIEVGIGGEEIGIILEYLLTLVIDGIIDNEFSALINAVHKYKKDGQI